MVEVLQDEVVVLHDRLQLLRESVHVAEIADTESSSCGLVLVGRADALAGGSDLLVAEGSFPCVINNRMIGQDQRAGLRNLQAAPDIHAGALKLAHLLEQRVRRQNNSGSDKAGAGRMEDPGGNKPDDSLLSANNQGMAGIVSALIANYIAGLLRQKINDLALSLVTPLGAQYNYILSHLLTQQQNHKTYDLKHCSAGSSGLPDTELIKELAVRADNHYAVLAEALSVSFHALQEIIQLRALGIRLRVNPSRLGIALSAELI